MADIFPQFMRMRLVETGAHTFSYQAFETPIIAGPDSYYVMNILKAFCWLAVGDGAQLVTVKQTIGSLQLTKNQNSSLLAPDNTNLILDYSKQATTLTSGAVIWQEPYVIDFSDGAGHGILCAEKEIFLAVDGDDDNAAALTANLWLLYTLVKISAQELLDMLQEE